MPGTIFYKQSSGALELRSGPGQRSTESWVPRGTGHHAAWAEDHRGGAPHGMGRAPQGRGTMWCGRGTAGAGHHAAWAGHHAMWAGHHRGGAPGVLPVRLDPDIRKGKFLGSADIREPRRC